MNKQLIFHEKTMEVKLTKNGELQSQNLACPLIMEIQIYFSCLLGKRLAFYTDQPLDGTWQVATGQFSSMLKDARKLTDNLYIRFNTVMTKSCPVSDYVGPPPVTDFVISNQKPYVPSWLNIDYKSGLWSGEYGWPASEAGYMNTKQVRAAAIRTEPDENNGVFTSARNTPGNDS